jgi:hypothetical protein
MRSLGSEARLKRCIFCGGSALSKEHVWADWIADYVPRTFYKSEHLVETMRSVPGSQPVERKVTKGPLHNNGDPASRKLRVVCENCNNGWMSSIQTQAKPILVLLIKGEPWQLDLNAQVILSSWATMFTLVYEAGLPEGAATPREAQLQFGTDQQPFPFWVISFGIYTGTEWRTRIESYSSMVKLTYGSIFHPPQAAKPNSQATTAVIGKLLIHTFYSLELPMGMFDEKFHRSLKLNP